MSINEIFYFYYEKVNLQKFLPTKEVLYLFSMIFYRKTKYGKFFIMQYRIYEII